VAVEEWYALGADQEVAYLSTAEHMVMVNTRIEDSLNSLLVSLSHDLGMNRSELVKACLRFALSSTAFREKMGLVLAEGDRLTLESLGDASVTIRTLVRRLSRRADIIMEHPSAAWLSIVRLNSPEVHK